MLTSLLLLSFSAEAGLFEPLRSRDPLPAREVERSPLTPMGWSTAELGLGRRTSGSSNQVGFDLDLSHGLARRVDGWLSLHHRTHTDDGLRTSGVAEPSFGLRGVVAQRDVGGTWLTWDLGYRAPLGHEHPNARLGPAISEANPRAWLGLIGRQRSGGLQVEAGARGAVDLPAAVGFGTPDPCGDVWTMPVSWIGPTPVGEGWLSALLQAGPLLFEGRLDAEGWGAREMRAARRDSKASCPPNSGPTRRMLVPGWAVDGRLGGGLQFSRGLIGRFEAILPVAEGGAVRPVHHVRGSGVRGSIQGAF